MEENNNNKIEINKEVKEANGQKLKTNRKTKLILSLVMIIVILVLLIILCVVNTYALKKEYKNVFDMIANMVNNEENPIEEEKILEEEKEIIIETIKEDNNKAYIYERENYEDKIKIPYININSEDARKINQEIYKMYEEAVKTITEDDDSQHYTEITYKYSILKNVICVCIDKTDIIMASGGFVPDRIIYNINLEDGKVLSTKEILAKLEIKEDYFIEKIESNLRKSYNENYYDITIDKYIEGFKYDINEVYFKSSSIAVIMATGDSVPYGYYESDVNLSYFEIEDNAEVQIPAKYSLVTEYNELSGSSVILNEDNSCLIYFGVTGQSFKGTYEIVGNTLICNLTQLRGEYISDTNINVEYHFTINDVKTLQFKNGTGEIGNVYSTLDQKEYKWEEVNVFEKDAILTIQEVVEQENTKYQDYIGGVWLCDDETHLEIIISEINDEAITFELLSYNNYSYGKQTSKFINNLKTSAEFHIKNDNINLGGYIDLVEEGIELRTIGTSNDDNIQSGKIYKFTKHIK